MNQLERLEYLIKSIPVVVKRNRVNTQKREDFVNTVCGELVKQIQELKQPEPIIIPSLSEEDKKVLEEWKKKLHKFEVYNPSSDVTSASSGAPTQSKESNGRSNLPPAPCTSNNKLHHESWIKFTNEELDNMIGLPKRIEPYEKALGKPQRTKA